MNRKKEPRVQATLVGGPSNPNKEGLVVVKDAGDQVQQIITVNKPGGIQTPQSAPSSGQRTPAQIGISSNAPIFLKSLTSRAKVVSPVYSRPKVERRLSFVPESKSSIRESKRSDDAQSDDSRRDSGHSQSLSPYASSAHSWQIVGETLPIPETRDVACQATHEVKLNEGWCQTEEDYPSLPPSLPPQPEKVLVNQESQTISKTAMVAPPSPPLPPSSAPSATESRDRSTQTVIFHDKEESSPPPPPLTQVFICNSSECYRRLLSADVCPLGTGIEGSDHGHCCLFHSERLPAKMPRRLGGRGRCDAYKQCACGRYARRQICFSSRYPLPATVHHDWRALSADPDVRLCLDDDEGEEYPLGD